MEWDDTGAWDDLAGRNLGPYRITQLIRLGGMAAVYRAQQPALGRDVAVKVLPSFYIPNAGLRSRFEREAQTAARLEHPHILPIYDYGHTDSRPYIVMRLVEGGTLRDWLQQDVPLARTVQVVRRVLSALKYAHSREPAVVHRDVKPENILMDSDDWPILADFGIAKILEPTTGQTAGGTMIGTPEYIAPEQSQGLVVDHRADLYAMGVILFELRTYSPARRGTLGQG